MATRMRLGLENEEEMLADLQEAHSTLQRAVKMLHRSAPTPVTTVAQLHSFPPAHRQVNNTFSALRREDKDVAAAAAGSTQTMTRAASAPPGPLGIARRFAVLGGRPASPAKSEFVLVPTSAPNKAARHMGVVARQALGLASSSHAQPLLQPQLHEMLLELERKDRENARLKDTLGALAKERDAAIESGCKAARAIARNDEDLARIRHMLEKAEEDQKRERAAAESLASRLEVTLRELGEMRSKVFQLEGEVVNLKAANEAASESRIHAEAALAESASREQRCINETRLARQTAEAHADLYKKELAAAAKVLAADAELKASRSADAAAAEHRRRARREARMLGEARDTRELLAARQEELSRMSESDLIELTAPYVEAAAVWAALEPRPLGSDPSGIGWQTAPPIALLSANWLRTQRDGGLPERQRLPPEAFITVEVLRSMVGTSPKGTASKGGSTFLYRPLPIICILHGRMALAMGGATHPDPSGHHLRLIARTLNERWSEFTRGRAGTSLTGITDLGILYEWGSLFMAPLEASSGKPLRRRSALEELAFGAGLEALDTLYASRLTTVWILPDETPGGGLGGRAEDDELQPLFAEAWPCYLHQIATLIKPCTLQLEGPTWPQILTLSTSGATSQFGAEAVTASFLPRCAPPAEPLAFRRGHRLAAHVGAWSASSCPYALERIEAQFSSVTLAALGGIEELVFRRCGWADESAARLASVLPACGRLRRLVLSANAIGDRGAVALATALATPTLASLEVLALDHNAIGDAGGAALFRAATLGEGCGEHIGQPHEVQAATPKDVNTMPTGAPSTTPMGATNAAQEPSSRLPTPCRAHGLPRLQTLALSHNELSDASVLGLLGALIAGSALLGIVKVELEGNPITQATLKEMAKALKKAKKKRGGK